MRTDGCLGGFGSPFTFTGELLDANDLLYLRARYYNPALGVFTALDPLEGDTARAMSLNRYGYVAGNVVNAVDPSGMINEPLGRWDNCYQQDDPCTKCCENTYANRAVNPLPPADEDIAISNCVRDCLNMPDHVCRHQPRDWCSISIAGWKPDVLGLTLPAYHLFIIFTDELGNEFVYRGGPKNGYVFAETQSTLDPEANDLTRLDRTAEGSMFFLDIGPDVCEIRSCLDREIDRINNSNTPYCAAGPTNSNTVASNLLESCNLPLLKPAYAFWTPGWDEADFVGDSGVKCWLGVVEQPDWWP
jgi:RHS repeat-associated protein